MQTILDCGHPPSEHSSVTTGYGKDANKKTYCYDCCAKRDKEQMDKDGRITLYFTGKEVANWPGSLRFPCTVQKGRHNIAGTRYDVWFKDHLGRQWHCKRSK